MPSLLEKPSKPPPLSGAFSKTCLPNFFKLREVDPQGLQKNLMFLLSRREINQVTLSRDTCISGKDAPLQFELSYGKDNVLEVRVAGISLEDEEATPVVV